MKHSSWIGATALVVSALACNLPSRTAPAALTETPPVGLTASAPPTLAPAEATVEGPPIPAGWLTYRDDLRGFEVSYPDSGIPINTNPPTAGDDNSVRIDLPFAPNTNLGEKYLQIDVRSDAELCASPHAEGFQPGDLTTEAATIGGIPWQKVSRSGVAAGNLYEFTAYSTMRNGVCVVLTFMLHSYNVGNFATPSAEFDRAAESAVFEAITATFRWLP